MPNCLHCGKSFQRKHPSQKFCPKVGGRHLCKDRYHNQRRAEDGNITEARREYLEERPRQISFGPWDEHKDG